MLGQSIWLDFISRQLIRGGDLKRLIDEDGLQGMTSNPSIFEKAIAENSDYDAQIEEILRTRDPNVKALYEELAIQDIRDAADLMRPVYDKTESVDGYVSLEVSPFLSRDTAGTVEEARRLWREVGRENVMIKVPATREGVPAIRQLVSEGININVTLLFSQKHYEEVADAYITGLESYAHGKEHGRRAVSRIASVASFFVSRIDTLADAMMDERIGSCAIEKEQSAPLERLKGKIAIANAKMAYRRYQRIYSEERWTRLAALGARPQRLLWASTSAKNPAYSDVMYVDGLIGRETVNTMPLKTLRAFQDHGRASPSLTQNVDEAEHCLLELNRNGISLDEITDMLTEQAIVLFSDPFNKLLGALEKKRRASLGKRVNFFSYELPAEMNLIVSERLGEWTSSGRVRELWKRDPRVSWKGWLTIAERTRARAGEIDQYVRQAKAGGVRDVLVLGMGGSSLAPAVFAKTFAAESLRIVDTTDPERIRELEDSIDLSSTLFIVSSKSGGTLEPNLLFAHFWDRLREKLPEETPEELGKRFAAITDPGSPLEKLAKDRKFSGIFHGDPEIGGRYSALSDFGMVPAAFAGVDLPRFLNLSLLMENSCSRWSPARENPGIHLGVVLGVLASHGRDKVTFISSSEIQALELWLEQLLAESTGKNGKGVIPIAGEELSSVEAYGPDRVFVYLQLENSSDTGRAREIDERLTRLQRSGQPVFRILIRDKINLGQEFFRWEMATAVLGSILEINPFDQPDVEAAKAMSRKILEEFERAGKLPEENRVAGTDRIRLSAEQGVQQLLAGRLELAKPSIAIYLEALFRTLQEGDYVALLAYLPDTPDITASLQQIRILIRNHMRVATCLEFGPRYLHSTGQAYKGGPNEGAFLVLTADTATKIPVSGKAYGFDTVIAAQALGDLRVLAERGRRVIQLHFGKDVLGALHELHSCVRHGLHRVIPLNNQVNTQGINRELGRGGGGPE